MKRVRIRRGTLLESEERQRQKEADAAWAKMEADARKLEATLPPASSSGPLVFSPELSCRGSSYSMLHAFANGGVVPWPRAGAARPDPRDVSAAYQAGRSSPSVFPRAASGQRDDALDAMLFALACTEPVRMNSRPTLTTILPSIERPEWPKTVLGRFMSRISTYFPPRLVGMVPLVAQEAAERDKMIAEVASHEEELKSATPQEVSLSTESLSFALDPSLPELDTSSGNELRDFVQDRIARDLRRIIGGLEGP